MLQKIQPTRHFQIALEEDQKQKIRALEFEARPGTIVHCEIQTIKGNTCYKCGNEGHFIEDCLLYQNNPIQHHNPTTNYKHSYEPHSRLNSNNTDVLATITPTLNNLLEQLKQLSTTNTSSQSTSSHHKVIIAIQIDMDINFITANQNTIAMVITTDVNQTVKIPTVKHITVNTAKGIVSMK